MAAAEEAVFEGVPAQVRTEFVEQAARLAMSIHHADPSLDACAAVLDALTDTGADR